MAAVCSQTCAPLKNAPIGGNTHCIFRLQRLTSPFPGCLAARARSCPDADRSRRLGANAFYQAGSAWHSGPSTNQRQRRAMGLCNFRRGPALSSGMVNPLLLLGRGVIGTAGLMVGLWQLQAQLEIPHLNADADVLIQLTQGIWPRASPGRLVPARAKSIMQLASGNGRTWGRARSAKRAAESRPSGADPIAPARVFWTGYSRYRHRRQ